MPSNYDQIRQENLEEYGKGTRHLEFLSNLYSNRTHFIYELLQNAEDALAGRKSPPSRTVSFHLSKHQLELRHYGRPFDEKDVRGVCGVGEGTKKDDLAQIGKFGVGFKAVYQYTRSPEIHSGGEHFCIEDFTRPRAASWDTADQDPTVFAFPLDRPDLSPDRSFADIGQQLRTLTARSLLFLRSIESISWLIDGQAGGSYTRSAKRLEDGVRLVTVTGRAGPSEASEDWVVFERPLRAPDGKTIVRVECAFLLGDVGGRQKSTAVVRADNTQLVAFFPTGRETRLGFLVQGPFRTTPSRDNVDATDAWNRRLVAEAASLVASALGKLRDLGFLTADTIEALPIRGVARFWWTPEYFVAQCRGATRGVQEWQHRHRQQRRRRRATGVRSGTRGAPDRAMRLSSRRRRSPWCGASPLVVMVGAAVMVVALGVRRR